MYTEITELLDMEVKNAYAIGKLTSGMIREHQATRILKCLHLRAVRSFVLHHYYIV